MPSAVQMRPLRQNGEGRAPADAQAQMPEPQGEPGGREPRGTSQNRPLPTRPGQKRQQRRMGHGRQAAPEREAPSGRTPADAEREAPSGRGPAPAAASKRSASAGAAESKDARPAGARNRMQAGQVNSPAGRRRARRSRGRQDRGPAPAGYPPAGHPAARLRPSGCGPRRRPRERGSRRGRGERDSRARQRRRPCPRPARHRCDPPW